MFVTCRHYPYYTQCWGLWVLVWFTQALSLLLLAGSYGCAVSLSIIHAYGSLLAKFSSQVAHSSVVDSLDVSIHSYRLEVLLSGQLPASPFTPLQHSASNGRVLYLGKGQGWASLDGNGRLGKDM